MHDYRLHVFRIAAEKMNFTRAAKTLRISQPAVTQHIKQLEDYYGTALFLRAPGGIVLTPAGRALIEHVVRVEALHAEIAERLRAGQLIINGPLSIVASTTIAQYLLPSLLGRFQQAHPKVELTLRSGNTEEVAGALLAGRVDLGLIEGPCARRDLKTERFADDEIVPVIAPAHPLAKKKQVDVSELADVPCVLREQGSGTRTVVERALRRAGLDPRRLNVVLECDASEAIKGVLETGVGVGFLSRLALRHELTVGSLKVLPVTGLHILRPFHVIYPQGPRPTGVVAAWIDFIQQTIP